ncbi:MAG: aminotransferase class IV, partial [Muribaculaceae bacterium]|nr:aminotransferase class IV [Muribaculaceae bacterium]
IRPLEIGLSPRVGVSPASEYLFIVMVSPVGPYFKGGFQNTNICITREFDRVAPRGTGRFKVGGNYAASLRAGKMAHDAGYSAVLFLDPKEKKYLDECGPANFYAIKDGKYITPASESILPSITNMSLQQLARDMGLEVECRHIPVDELESMDEAAACGTAAVCSPIGHIDDLDTGKKYMISKDGKPGPVTTALYNKLNAIRLGEEPDVHGWNTIVE